MDHSAIKNDWMSHIKNICTPEMAHYLNIIIMCKDVKNVQ